jgi:hypothetical protein
MMEVVQAAAVQGGLTVCAKRVGDLAYFEVFRELLAEWWVYGVVGSPR